MEMMRGCLMIMGLVMLLMITSCVVGVSGCSRLYDPREFSRTVTEGPDKTRRMVRDYMESATLDGDALKVRDRPVAVTVQDYSDGSIHLIARQDEKTLMEVTAVFLPREEGETRVEVVSDARPLATALHRRDAAEIHRGIKTGFESAFDAISRDQVLPRGLMVSRLIAEQKNKRSRW